MEKLADRIEKFLEKQLSLYEALESVVEKEKKQIVDMDSDALWKTTDRKRKICRDLEQSYNELKKSLNSSHAEFTGKEGTFRLSGLIQVLPVSAAAKSKLRQMQLRLELCREKISVIAAANKQYVQDSLAIIDDIFSQGGEEKAAGQYNHSGQAQDRTNPIRLIRTEV